jgi:hypothetical protein
MAESEEKPAPPQPTKEELKLALKAFRKRLNLTRLDDESRLGYGPMTSGGKSGVVAITPPNQFPPAVWEELARQGKLKHAGGALYELVGP